MDKARIETPVLYTYKRQTAVEVRGEIRFRATARRGASRARDRRSRGCGKWAGDGFVCPGGPRSGFVRRINQINGTPGHTAVRTHIMHDLIFWRIRAEGRRKQRTCGSVVSGETRKCVVFKHKEAFCV